MKDDLEYLEGDRSRFKAYLRTGTRRGTELFQPPGGGDQLRVMIDASYLENESVGLSIIKKLVDTAQARIFFHRQTEHADAQKFWGMYEPHFEWDWPAWLPPVQAVDVQGCQRLIAATNPIDGMEIDLDAIAIAFLASSQSIPLVIRPQGSAGTKYLDYATCFVDLERAIPILAHYCRSVKSVYWPGSPFKWVSDRRGVGEFYRDCVTSVVPKFGNLLAMVNSLSRTSGESTFSRFTLTVIGRLAQAIHDFDKLVTYVSASPERVRRDHFGQVAVTADMTAFGLTDAHAIGDCLDGILLNLVGSIDALARLYFRVVLAPSGLAGRMRDRDAKLHVKEWFDRYVVQVYGAEKVSVMFATQQELKRVTTLRNFVHGIALEVGAAGNSHRWLQDVFEQNPNFARTEWVVHIDREAAQMEEISAEEASAWGMWDALWGTPMSKMCQPATESDTRDMTPDEYLKSRASFAADVATLAHRSIGLTLRFVASFIELLTSLDPLQGVNTLRTVKLHAAEGEWLDRLQGEEAELLRYQSRLLSFDFGAGSYADS